MSGTEKGVTLGTPIGIFVPNENVRPKDYSDMEKVPRPGHADYAYRIKYGINAISGGGRASARETIGRVAAGAIAEKWLKVKYGTTFSCWVSRMGTEDIRPEANFHPSGRPWSREEVDTLGTLELLRDPKTCKTLTSEDEPDEKLRNKKQAELYDVSWHCL